MISACVSKCRHGSWFVIYPSLPRRPSRFQAILVSSRPRSESVTVSLDQLGRPSVPLLLVVTMEQDQASLMRLGNGLRNRDQYYPKLISLIIFNDYPKKNLRSLLSYFQNISTFWIWGLSIKSGPSARVRGPEAVCGENKTFALFSLQIEAHDMLACRLCHYVLIWKGYSAYTPESSWIFKFYCLS